jgi:peptidoglycan hydrolase CwlO-like protein
MTIDQLLLMLGGLSISVIGYFLKSALSEIREVKIMAIETKQKLAVLEVDYLNKVSSLNDKIDALQETIKDLTRELKEYNKNIR